MKQKKTIPNHFEYEDSPTVDSHNNTFFKNVVTSSVVSIFVLAVWAISQKINQVQPIPYLDEIYHVPQAQEYCKGNFSYWDNRITTLPGLYLISVGIIKPLSDFTGNELCETIHLRYINILLSLFNLLLYIWIIRKVNLQDNKKNVTNYWKELLSAFNVAIFPPLFFFSFLYYTDMAAACLVFLMYSLHLGGGDISAAAAGIVAIFCRQTSIVWTCLFAVARMDLVLQHTLLSKKERSPQIIGSWKLPKALIEKLMKTKSFSQCAELAYKLIVQLWAYVVVGVLFILFVMMNEGLVVGDRNAHKATVNLPQMFYFFGLVVIFGAPHWLSYIQPFVKTCLMKWQAILLITALAAVVIRFNTIVHPYLLADNRHYTFYVWKRLYEYYPMGRYLVMPLYLFGAYASYNTLVKKSFLFALAFFAMSFIALVPQRLLEIRYFFIPFLLMRLHVPPRSWIPLILELLMNIFLNAVTLYLFITRPFYWADSDLVQRFMW